MSCCKEKKPVFKLTPCECTEPGFCPRHKCIKTPGWLKLCQTRRAYFDNWERGGGPCRERPILPPKWGPGDYLAWCIEKATFGLVRAKAGCGCDKRKQWLNRTWKRIREGRIRPAKVLCGVTTAPRTTPYLSRTLGCLTVSGFRPVLFAEPGTELPKGFTRRENDDRLGAFHTWLRALDALSRVRCERILLCQDDIVCCAGLREFCERMPWPENAGVVSLYCPTSYADGSGFKKAPAATWGACALLFKREAARAIVESDMAKTWPIDRRIDIFVGRFMEAQGLDFLYRTPSLVQHVGEVSTFDSRGLSADRRAVDFAGEQFDARFLLPSLIR